MDKDYNTSRSKMIMPEYGRHIHRMVEYIKSLPEKEERNKAARQIVQVMSFMNSSFRDSGEYRHKVWDHLAIIADFELDIDYPVEITQKEALFEKPKKVPYPEKKIRFKHYGKGVESQLIKLSQMEDGEKKTVYVEMLANYMKKLYLLWNKEAVSDELIFKDILDITGSQTLIKPEMKLSETRDILQRTRKFRKNNRKK
ncbi:MAG: DUF4290 domain-containing protein [Bacteroidetes bacterium HGW-Bacteroidetes-21]|nr:MAG: DUF4290 domain-containing protein [Bacteroidetes bacterium HGW-Bacteroidetes-21]